VDIDAGKPAQSKGSKAEVKAFGPTSALSIQHERNAAGDARGTGGKIRSARA
jgi:hypothetical protein